MKIEYFADTDSLFITLKEEQRVAGAEVEPGIVLHYTRAGAVAAIDIDSEASKLVDVSRLNVEGLPAEVRAAPREVATPRRG